MKKYLSLLMMIVLLVSCSKKVEVKGHIKGATPLQRIEIIEAAGVGTLPIASIPVDSKGDFSGEFIAPKNGMYLITYGGGGEMYYLKSGQKLEISGEEGTFPSQSTIKGDAKANNDFLKHTDEAFKNYANKINVESLIGMKEEAFIKEYQKIQTDLFKSIEDLGSKDKADAEVIDYKKKDIGIKLLGLLDMYEKNHGMSTANVQYKPSAKLLELKKEITKDADKLVKEFPMYREYVLGTLNSEFQEFAQPKILNASPTNPPLLSDLFSQFIKNRKELSDTVKDYIFAYIISQSDINYQNTKKYDKITQLIDDNVKDTQVKNNLKELQKVLMGFKAGTTPELPLLKADGTKTNLDKLKGKPTLVFFYASYNPNIAVNTVPILKDLNELYASKVDFIFVNLDDTQDQFSKTSTAMFKDFKGQNYYLQGGINADAAKKFGLYTFKTPNIVLIDKDGKLVGRPYFNINDGELTNSLEKLTGIKAPQEPAIAPSLELVPPIDSTKTK